MVPLPAKKRKQASLLSFFEGVKELKNWRGGDDDGSGHCSHVAGDDDEDNINDDYGVNNLAGIEETNPVYENNEQQDHHSLLASPYEENDDIYTVSEPLFAISPTVSMTDESAPATTDGNAAKICVSIVDNGVISNNCMNDEEKDDGSSSTSSSCSQIVKDENDAVTHNSDVNVGRKSAYELLREKNIARNNARLKQLGLLVGVDAKKYSDRCTKQQRQPPKRGRTNSTIEQRLIPARRSRRLEKNVATTTLIFDDDMTDLTSIMSNSIELEGKNIEETDLFSVSPLLEYQMTLTQHHEEACPTSNTIKGDGQEELKGITSLVLSNSRLFPPSGLNAIYSLQFYPSHYFGGISISENRSSSPWLVGAGKSGIIALWDCSSSNKKSGESIDPVISWKGHCGRWIADARFLPPPPTTRSNDDRCSIWGGGSVPSRLLTAGNDGTVCHWDLMSTSSKTGIPKLLNQSSKVLHASGIFSMDVNSCLTSDSFLHDIRIVTGSKDKTIALSSLDRLDNGPLWRSDFHRAKVGSVNFSSVIAHSDIPLIASASDDGMVAIHDARLNGMSRSNNCIVAQLADIHIKPHSAVWMPGSAQILMTGQFR